MTEICRRHQQTPTTLGGDILLNCRPMVDQLNHYAKVQASQEISHARPRSRRPLAMGGDSGLSRKHFMACTMLSMN